MGWICRDIFGGWMWAVVGNQSEGVSVVKGARGGPILKCAHLHSHLDFVYTHICFRFVPLISKHKFLRPIQTS